MIAPEFFVKQLQSRGIDFFTGVPDSLLKGFCAYISSHLKPENHIIAANEGGAVALAAGYHLASGRIAGVYMQNSGIGNAVNPLLSLVDREVYNIPMLLIIGWRGEPGVKDEPQHVKQGKTTISLLDTMGIKNAVLSDDNTLCAKQIDDAISYIETTNEVFAFVVKKDVFENQSSDISTHENEYILPRESAIQTVVDNLGERDIVVSTTGMISRELFEYREERREGHQHDFLTVGSMGHASQIALGIALQKAERRVWCFDGDGASIMHLGNLAIVGSKGARNLVHVVFNNGAHDSVGGQPTAGFLIDLPQIALACGYSSVFSESESENLKQVLDKIKQLDGPIFLEIKVKKGARKNLGRPTTTPLQNKQALMNCLSDRL
ncbi:MAG: phosphonopyruvate decarboxylase [Dysgonamonadaceae bacterium]|jgi:phosphonopyruvate decarboxylase|nr:phosphonopyruvate decarboxylase [Dysgonamonadaceae bacterium]